MTRRSPGRGPLPTLKGLHDARYACRSVFRIRAWHFRRKFRNRNHSDSKARPNPGRIDDKPAIAGPMRIPHAFVKLHGNWLADPALLPPIAKLHVMLPADGVRPKKPAVYKRTLSAQIGRDLWTLRTNREINSMFCGNGLCNMTLHFRLLDLTRRSYGNLRTVFLVSNRSGRAFPGIHINP